jgi:hypothetical protein
MSLPALMATLVLDGYGGRYEQAVDIVGETATRFRIRAINRTRLGGRNRILEVGQVALVPKTAIRTGVRNQGHYCAANQHDSCGGLICDCWCHRK